MADQQLNTEQREALMEAFNTIDTDHSGAISKSELRTLLQLIGQNPTPEEMNTYMENAEDGELGRDSFVAFIEKYIPLKSEEQIDKELMQAFERFDEDKDMFISREEFRHVLTQFGEEPVSERDTDALLDSLDTLEKDGRLSVEELSKLFIG